MGKTIEWPKAVESISAEGTKTYYVGDTLDISDLKVVLNLADGSTMQIMADEYNVVPRVFTSANQEVTVLYRWGDQSFTTAVTGLTVNALEVTSAAIKSDFKKKVYKVGETFNPEGFSLLVKYNNGNFDIISEGIEYSEPDMSTTGTKTVTATYEGQSVDSDIEVEEIKVIALLTKTSPKTDYLWGDELDATGAEMVAIFDDGTQRDVTDDCTFEFDTGGTTAEQGTTSIVVSYSTLEKSIAVTTSSRGIISSPNISISESTLSITSSDENTEGYEIYVDGDMVESITISDLSTSYDLSTLSLEEGDHEVFVKGWAENYEDSSASNIVIYTVEPPQVTGIKVIKQDQPLEYFDLSTESVALVSMYDVEVDENEMPVSLSDDCEVELPYSLALEYSDGSISPYAGNYTITPGPGDSITLDGGGNILGNLTVDEITEPILIRIYNPDEK